MKQANHLNVRFAQRLAALLYPAKCPFCGRILDGVEAEICPDCQQSLPWTHPEETRTAPNCAECFAPLWYRDGVSDAVHRYKFNGGQNYAPLFASLMAACVSERQCGAVDAVTWAPLSQKRLRERGYDQARLLAERTALLLEVPSVSLLKKCRNTLPQSHLEDEAARRQNVSGAYQLLPGAACAGKRLLLVDDVLTTGSTIGECAAALKGAGAAWVAALTLAWARG